MMKERSLKRKFSASRGEQVMKRKRRDAAQLDVFKMRPRGKPGPKVVAYRDRKGRFMEIMKVDRDVKGLKVKRKKK